MPPSPARHTSRLVAAFALVVACASCGPPAAHSAQRPNVVTAAQATDEYRAEANSLTLAPGWKWPANPSPPSTGPDGRPQVYQRGYGTTAADLYWYCSWRIRYLDPTLSEADRNESYQTLKRVRNTHLYNVDIVERDRPLFNKEIDDAGLGDSSAMQHDVQLNCPKDTS